MMDSNASKSTFSRVWTKVAGAKESATPNCSSAILSAYNDKHRVEFEKKSLNVVNWRKSYASSMLHVRLTASQFLSAASGFRQS